MISQLISQYPRAAAAAPVTHHPSPVTHHPSLAVLAGILLLAAGAMAAPPAPKGPDPTQKLAEIEQAQQAAAAQLADVQEKLKAVEARLAEAQEQLRRVQDDGAIDRDMLEKIRNENLGLYVMDSSTKEMVTKVGEQVEALSGQLEKFRISVGILAALVVVLQAFGIALLFIRRG